MSKEVPTVRRMVILLPSQDDWLIARAAEVAAETSQRPNISAVVRVAIDNEIAAHSKRKSKK